MEGSNTMEVRIFSTHLVFWIDHLWLLLLEHQWTEFFMTQLIFVYLDVGAGSWNCAPQQSLPQRRSSQRELETRLENRQHTPFLSVAIAVAHIVILIMTMQQNDCPNHTTETCLNPSLHRFAFQPFGENPLLGPSAKTLLTMGALESDLVTKAHEGWRVITAIWLHAGVLHIMGTSLGMLLLGIPLERQLGFVKVDNQTTSHSPSQLLIPPVYGSSLCTGEKVLHVLC